MHRADPQVLAVHATSLAILWTFKKEIHLEFREIYPTLNLMEFHHQEPMPQTTSQPKMASDMNEACNTPGLVALFLDTVSIIQRKKNEGGRQDFLMILTKRTLPKAEKELTKLELELSGSLNRLSRSIVMHLIRRLPHFLGAFSR